jgi:hypothetical protein
LLAQISSQLLNLPQSTDSEVSEPGPQISIFTPRVPEFELINMPQKRVENSPQAKNKKQTEKQEWELR